MGKGISLNPKTFSDSRFLSAVQQYKPPDKDEPKSRFSVSGFPTTLLNTLCYVLPAKLGVSWRYSHATVERFLFNLGVPMLDNDTQCCSVYADLMASATGKCDYGAQAKLRAYKFSYDIESMRMLGGREVCAGGTKLQCLTRDSLRIKDISVRLANTDLSPLISLSVVYALSSDDDYQVVPVDIVKMCQKIVSDFQSRIKVWQDELRGLD